jgi:hypothetical protein
MDFLEYITNLAEEGETALIVRQKPVVYSGQPVTHADGSPKYTWPAFLPDHKRREGQAWYVNTGSFIIDRLKDGKPSASVSNCQFCLFMMLDDIGTKSKEPPLPPTWIMETSPGSFQWGYAYSEQPTVGEQTAALSVIAAAGYTDPGATNAVRNCRLPGSVNLKPGRDNFAARLVEFHPGREYTLPQICEALGVAPGEADTPHHHVLQLRDTGKDTVLTWLNEHNLVLSNVNSEGWMGVVCPNHAEHTDGQIEARYKPLDRSFCCYHGHCEHLDSRAFLGWVAEQGGPRVLPGLRDELLAEHMASVRAMLEPTAEYPDEAQKIVEDVNRRELGRLEKNAWYERFAYVVDDDAYFDMGERREYTRSAFNALYRHVKCVSIHNGRKVEASVCYDENRQHMGARTLQALVYAAGDAALVERDGLVYGNMWRNARPTYAASTGDISRWLDHAARIIPDPVEREHVLNVMAVRVQQPRTKINHAILHGGDEGCGKDTLWAPVLWAVCGPAMKNRGLIDNDSLGTSWGYHLESEILILNELKEPEARERRALANKLKPLIAAPPATLPVNRKGLHPYDMVNRIFVLAFTNDPVPISLASQDRRWCCIWSPTGRMDPHEAAAMWRWYEKEGGYQAIARWLADRDVSAFNPAAAPPVTDWKVTMVEQGMSIAESFLVDMIRERRGEFARGVIGAPFYALCDRLLGHAPTGVKLHHAQLLHAFKEAKWVDLGRVASVRHTTKKQMFAAPDMAKKHTKSTLRDMIEEPPVTTLKVV